MLNFPAGLIYAGTGWKFRVKARQAELELKLHDDLGKTVGWHFGISLKHRSSN